MSALRLALAKHHRLVSYLVYDSEPSSPYRIRTPALQCTPVGNTINDSRIIPIRRYPTRKAMTAKNTYLLSAHQGVEGQIALFFRGRA